MRTFILSLIILAIIIAASAFLSTAAINALSSLHDTASLAYDANGRARAELTKELARLLEENTFTLSLSLYGNDIRDLADEIDTLSELCLGEYEDSEYRVSCRLLIDDLEKLSDKLKISFEGVL
ncbi:MAG: hypothetical protein LUD44_03500 [Firmicutes bacterium]|nr:hypothetical protein [Bacillota bacterium]